LIESLAMGFELHTHAKDDAVLAGLIKIDMADGRSADAREEELEIPLGCVVASAGQSPVDIRLGGIVDPPKGLSGPSFSETKACVAIEIERVRAVLSTTTTTTGPGTLTPHPAFYELDRTSGEH
jgi:hypothetical protein